MTDRRLHRALIGVTIVGLAVASYLTYIHYAGIKPICNISHGCEKVQGSEWAKVAGVPVALIGLIGYVTIFASLFVRGETARLATAGLTFVGFCFSVYLTYLEIFQIKAICQWCVGSAVIMTILLVLSWTRALRGFDDHELPAPSPLMPAGDQG
jgi:uncharacterized membrane protein